MDLSRIRYADLNARQKESYNFQKVSALLADFGFSTIRLSDDWQGADFLAQHVGGDTFLRVQLKGRLTFEKKYLRKRLHIAFPHGDDWYLYPHDDLLLVVLAETTVGTTVSWREQGGYSFPSIPARLAAHLEPYRIHGDDLRIGPTV